jgi:hypothetical protein
VDRSTHRSRRQHRSLTSIDTIIDMRLITNIAAPRFVQDVTGDDSDPGWFEPHFLRIGKNVVFG